MYYVHKYIYIYITDKISTIFIKVSNFFLYGTSRCLVELKYNNKLRIFSLSQQCFIIPLVATRLGHFDHHRAIAT